MMKVLIIEDVILVAQRIAGLINEYLDYPDITLSHTLSDAKKVIEEDNIDLLLLDLNINGLDGFEMLQVASAQSFQTIIITANADKAVIAFEYGVLDFIAKPISKQRIQKALSRFLNGHSTQRESLRYLTIKLGQHLTFISVPDIAFIRGSGNYSEVFTDDGRSHIHNKNLDKLIKILPTEFKRIHRSYIAPQSKIKNLINHGAGKYTAEISKDISLPVSRNIYNEHFKFKS